ncbi:MAG: 3-phenylpropionate/cinnamic acid dioxygenase subunit beta [Acidimicrobiales bacterium]
MAATHPAVADALLHHQASQWLFHEAGLLDSHRYRDWLGLLADDVSYRMPVTVTRNRDDTSAPPTTMDHFNEDRYSLGLRVERLLGDHAWTEDPPSRTRRFVTNICAAGAGDAALDDAALEVTSCVLLFRSRGDRRPADIVSAWRSDTLRRVDGAWRLARRDITIDEAVLQTQNLAVFL